MFQQSLIESTNQLASGNQRWIAVGSVMVQSALALGLVAVPLLHPEALTFRTLAPAVMVPLVHKPPVVIVERHQPAAASAYTPPVQMQLATRGAVLPTMRSVDTPDPGLAALSPAHLSGMGSPGLGLGELLGSADTATGRRVVAAAPRQPLAVSAGVSAGMLLGEIRPVYPRIAVAAHVQGVVVIEAIISRTGTIESAHVLSGPVMLAGAALEAVRAARYRPYLLNGEPTEVRTSVTVNFRLGGM